MLLLASVHNRGGEASTAVCRYRMEGELHKTTLLLLTSGHLAISSPAAPADKVLIMDPQNALSSDEFKAALGNDVAFYFIGAAKPAVKTQMEEILIK